MSAHKNRQSEAAKIAGLPRAERFEALISFPTKHVFKAIGRAGGFSKAVQKTLSTIGFDEVELSTRQSAKQTYVSLTFELSIKDGQQLDQIYSALETIPGLASLL